MSHVKWMPQTHAE